MKTWGSAIIQAMNANTRPIPEIVADRKRVALQVSELHKNLERLDSELFSALESIMSAFGGASTMPAPQPTFVVPPIQTLQPPTNGPPLPPGAKKFISYVIAPVAPVKHGEIGTVIHDRVREVLREVKKPLKTRDLFNALTDKGVQIPGKDPQNNLSAHSSRSTEFVSGRDGWWFRELA